MTRYQIHVSAAPWSARDPIFLFSQRRKTRKTCDDARWKCWGDPDARTGRARVGPERDWPSHPGRRSLQPPGGFAGLKPHQACRFSLPRILDRDPGKQRQQEDAEARVCPWADQGLHVRTQGHAARCYLATPPPNGEFPPRLLGPLQAPEQTQF